jgi:hypothetical protein
MHSRIDAKEDEGVSQLVEPRTLQVHGFGENYLGRDCRKLLGLCEAIRRVRQFARVARFSQLARA